MAPTSWGRGVKRDDVSAGPPGPWHVVRAEHGLQRLVLSEELHPRRSGTKEARPLGRCGQLDRAVTETGPMPLAAAHCTDRLQGDTQAPRCTWERRHRAGQGLAQSTRAPTPSSPRWLPACPLVTPSALLSHDALQTGQSSPVRTCLALHL